MLSVSACTRSLSPRSKPVLVVNKAEMTAEEFGDQLAKRLKDLDALSAKDAQHVQRAKEAIIQEFIISSLVTQWAEIKKIQISSEEVDKEIDKIRATYPDDNAFRQGLANQGLSLSDWKKKMRYTLLEREVFKLLKKDKPPVSEQEIQNYYSENKEQFKRKELIYVRHILVDDESKANLMKAELKDKDFASLAKKYSIAPDAADGGAIGWIEKGSVDYFDPLFSQAIGAVSAPFTSPFGVHIAKVEKKQAAQTMPLESVRERILNSIEAKREQALYLAWLDGQIRSSNIKKDVGLIDAMKVSTRGENE